MPALENPIPKPLENRKKVYLIKLLYTIKNLSTKLLLKPVF
jgi:hypothetical protein